MGVPHTATQETLPLHVPGFTCLSVCLSVPSLLRKRKAWHMIPEFQHTAIDTSDSTPDGTIEFQTQPQTQIGNITQHEYRRGA